MTRIAWEKGLCGLVCRHWADGKTSTVREQPRGRVWKAVGQKSKVEFETRESLILWGWANFSHQKIVAPCLW